MLLSDDIGVVECLNASLNRELITHLILVHVLHADLVVASVESGEMVSHFLLVAQGNKFLAFGVSDRQNQVLV